VLLVWRRGYSNHELCASRRRVAPSLDPTTVSGYDLVHHGESKPGPTLGSAATVIESYESLKDPRGVVVWHTGSIV